MSENSPNGLMKDSIENNYPQQARLQNVLTEEFSSVFSICPPLAGDFGLTFSVSVDNILIACTKLKENPKLLFNMLIDITAVDWLDRRVPRFEVVYNFLSLTYLHRLCVKVEVTEEKPELESIRSLWPAANFLEREVWDMYGIKFIGHGDLRRVLLYEEFVGHPLRKDYPLKAKQPRVKMRIPELRNNSVDMIRDELVSLPSPVASKQTGTKRGQVNG